MRRSIVIPAHNEAATVAIVVRAALKSPVDEILIVDDGSRDRTPAILSTFRGERRVRVIRHTRNQGVGAARRHGARAARGSIIGFFDADVRNASPAMIKKLFAPIIVGKADFVIGRSARSGRLSRFFARPLLAHHLPALAYLERPLCGLFAAKRRFLFPGRMGSGHAVLGILLDAYFNGARIAEADLGMITHARKRWSSLIPQAKSELRGFRKRVPGRDIGTEELRAFIRKAASYHA